MTTGPYAGNLESSIRALLMDMELVVFTAERLLVCVYCSRFKPAMKWFLKCKLSGSSMESSSDLPGLL